MAQMCREEVILHFNRGVCDYFALEETVHQRRF